MLVPPLSEFPDFALASAPLSAAVDVAGLSLASLTAVEVGASADVLVVDSVTAGEAAAVEVVSGGLATTGSVAHGLVVLVAPTTLVTSAG